MGAEGIAFFGGFILLYILIFGAQVASSVCLGIAIYNDALSWGDDNAVMWGVLTGFFGWIPALIYFVIRSRAKKVLICYTCGGLIPPGVINCQRCGRYHPEARPIPPDTLLRSRKAKRFLIAWGVLMGSMVVICVLFVIFMMSSTFMLAGPWDAAAYRF